MNCDFCKQGVENLYMVVIGQEFENWICKECKGKLLQLIKENLK